MTKYDMSLANALLIAVWYVPMLLAATLLLWCCLPLLAFMVRFNPDRVHQFVDRADMWLTDKDAEIEDAIKRLSRKK